MPSSAGFSTRTFPLPICAVCKREVEKMSVGLMGNMAAYKFTVTCHGKRQSRLVSQLQLDDAKISILPGVAFEEEEMEANSASIDTNRR